MKFVYFGYDFMLHAVHRLIEEGHELLGIFSFECDNIFNFNQKTRALADELSVPFTIARPEPPHIENYMIQGAEVFLAAGYLYKIPPVDESKAYALNLHPSYLPRGRGLMPMPHILMHQPEAAGVTLHKMSQAFDKGDILLQEKIELAADEDVETYSARVAIKSPALIAKAFAGLEKFWANASPQDETRASYFKPPDEAMRTLDWNKKAAEIDKTARAFGRFGCLAPLSGQVYVVYNLKTWREAHDLRPGVIACTLSREVVVACADGFVCLKEFDKVS